MTKYKITACIVMYNNNIDVLRKCIDSLLDYNKEVYLLLVDNSRSDNLKKLTKNNFRIEYIHNPSNPGFGAAHNIAIQKAIKLGSKYHFVVNPDVFFNKNIITPMVEYLKLNKNVGMLMPQILNYDETIQNLPKLLPSPYSVFMRKFKFPLFIYKSFINNYELRFVSENLIYNTPILSGCFTLFKVEALEKVGGYDDDFFMYFEDWDLSRRIHKLFETVYYPKVSIYHGYESGANTNFKLLKIFINSAFKYFNKWGWFFDSERRIVNKKALSQFD